MRTPKTILLAAFAALALFAGCEKAGPRKAISGTVTFKGAPLDTGSILFHSASDGIQAGGVMVKDGKFNMPAEHGLEPGTYKVSVSSPKGMAERTPAEIASGGSPSAKEQIPPEYNVKTKLTIEVTASGPNNFTLVIE